MTSWQRPERKGSGLTFLRAAIAAILLTVAGCAGEAATDTRAAYTPAPPEPGNPIAGARVYTGSCSGCHGADLKGVADLGQQLVPSDVVIELTEDEMVAFLIEGLPADHPDNRTGVEMPPKGGSPWLTDQDLHDVAAYVSAQQ